jgi:hypothetical protein
MIKEIARSSAPVWLFPQPVSASQVSRAHGDHARFFRVMEHAIMN